jgi:hypothetical protein
MNERDLLWTLWSENWLLRRIINYNIISAGVICFSARRWGTERVRERAKQERNLTSAFRKSVYGKDRQKSCTLSADWGVPRLQSEFLRRIRCSGMWRCMAGLACNDVSKEPAAFIFFGRRFQEENKIFRNTSDRWPTDTASHPSRIADPQTAHHTP